MDVFTNRLAELEAGQTREPATEAEYELAQALNLADTYKKNARQSNDRIATLLGEQENFKRAVVTTALAYAKEHGWCNVVKEALREMGLDVPPTRYTAVVTTTHYVTVEVEDGDDFDENDMQYAIDGADLQLSKDGVYFDVYDSNTSVDSVEADEDY